MQKLFMLVLIVAAGWAQAVDRSEKIRALMEAQGPLDTFEQQLQAARESARTTAKQVLDQMLSDLASPPPATQQKFKSAAEEFFQEIQSPWTSKEMVDVWSNLYGTEFSDEELDQLLATTGLRSHKRKWRCPGWHWSSSSRNLQSDTSLS